MAEKTDAVSSSLFDTSPGRPHLRSFSSIEEVLDFAMDRELQSQHFYTTLSKHTSSYRMRLLFIRFAAQEEGHYIKLKRMREDAVPLIPSSTEPWSLDIYDYVTDVVPSGTLDYASALVVAMRAEKTAYRLYMRLSRETSSPDVSLALQMLAQEEANHKLHFELEYEDYLFYGKEPEE